MRQAILSKAAGWILSAFGAVHIVVATFDTRATWSQVAAEGWWNTFTLDRAVSLDDLRRSETFWADAGSFGVPLLALGRYILWSVHRNDRVPGWLGWLLVSYGTITGIMLPKSPVWALNVAGLLIVRGDRQRRPTPAGSVALSEATRR